MLRSVREIIGYRLLASDGEIGTCTDFLFDDRDWVVRYMVADTRKWLPGRKVLISPASLGEPDWNSRLFPVSLSRGQIRESPALDEHAPVSRQYERTYHEFLGYGLYWEGTGLWGAYPDPSGIVHPVPGASELPEPESGQGHLRSVNELHGYQVHSSDDEFGMVEDFVVDDHSWAIEWLVVDTRRWLPGRKVLVSPEWTESVDWVERRVDFAVTSEQIKNSPDYDPGAPINREYEANLYDFYGRPKRR
ncbi:MAG: PRC-barrel domain-containing protein [Gammaproteobacteria bacterium]|jgi:hypothetical protein